MIAALLGIPSAAPSPDNPPEPAQDRLVESELQHPDREAYSAVLSARVNEHGFVDYAALTADRAALDRYLASLADADVWAFEDHEQLAILINAYNAFTLRLITEHYQDGGPPETDGRLTSIMQIPEEQRWDHQRWNLGGKTVSLNQLEHQIIRVDFDEPRIHFALVCAATSCPTLRAEPYTGDTLEEQLAHQSSRFHERDDAFRFDPRRLTVHLSSVYDWFAEDFTKAAGSPAKYAARFDDELDRALKRNRSVDVRYIQWNWTLNDQAIRTARR